MNRDMALRTVSIQGKINIGGGASTQFLQEAADRVGIIVNAPLTNRFTLSLATGAVLDEGITLYPGNDPLILTVEQHGQLVVLAWTAVSATAAQDVTVIETFLRS